MRNLFSVRESYEDRDEAPPQAVILGFQLLEIFHLLHGPSESSQSSDPPTQYSSIHQEQENINRDLSVA